MSMYKWNFAKNKGEKVDNFRACFSNWSFVSRTSYGRRSSHLIAQRQSVAQNSMIALHRDSFFSFFFLLFIIITIIIIIIVIITTTITVCAVLTRARPFVRPPLARKLSSLSRFSFVLDFFFSHFALFVVNVVLTWLFSFFFWFCCCVGVVCEAGAWTTEARRCHRLPSRPCRGEDCRISVFFSFPFLHSLIFLRCWLFKSFCTFPSSSFLFVLTHVVSMTTRPSRNSYARTRSLHLLLITLSVNRWLYIVMKSSHCTQFIIMAWIFD